ncbi:hypothetical protein Tco_1489002, partial [Tanacetum coccineum]
KEVDIGLDGGRDKPLRPADMLLYSWDEGLDVCVDLTGFSPLTQTEMVDFVPGRAVIDAAQHKRGKYVDRCAAIGYGFLPFSFSLLGELEADTITLLKRIWKFSITQDIEARTAIHISNRISFAIAKGVEAQIRKSGPLKKADVILSLQSELTSLEIKESLDADEDIGVDEVSSAIDDVFDIGESNVESMEVRSKFGEFSKNKKSVEEVVVGGGEAFGVDKVESNRVISVLKNRGGEFDD